MQKRADLETRLKSSRYSNDKNRFQNFHDILAPRRKIFGISCIVVAVDVVDVIVFVVVIFMSKAIVVTLTKVKAGAIVIVFIVLPGSASFPS